MCKRYLILLFILLAGCWHTANAHTHPQPRQGQVRFPRAFFDPDPNPQGEFQTLVVPFKRAGNLIVIEAQIDSVFGNFILDTGAPYLVLNKTYFRDASHIADQDANGVNGSGNGTFKTTVKQLTIFDLRYEKLTADVTDLSAIENGRNIKILGLLGTRLFNKLAITVDVQRNVLYIHRLNEKGEIPVAERIFAKPDLKTNFRLLNNVVFLKGVANGHNLWFAFDTAAETNLIDYNRNKKLVQSMTVLSTTKLTGIGGSSYQVITAEFDKLEMEDNVFFLKNKALVTNLERMGNAYGYTVDAMLGYDFFSRGIFTINFVKKEFEMYIYIPK